MVTNLKREILRSSLASPSPSLPSTPSLFFFFPLFEDSLYHLLMTFLPSREEAFNSSHNPQGNNITDCAGDGTLSVPNKLTVKCNSLGKCIMIKQPKYTPNIWLLLLGGIIFNCFSLIPYGFSARPASHLLQLITPYTI